MSENAILNHYKIDTLFPSEWPAEKEGNNSSDDDAPPPAPISVSAKANKRKSRYSALQRHSRRTSVPGAQISKDGIENLVQMDEPDPLGGNSSVVNVLRQRGVSIEMDNKLRNRFLLSSTTFSASSFLSKVHGDASTADLLDGLMFLSQSIEKKSASLKVLVESNFERFVRAKSTIDTVYKEMVNQGLDAADSQQSGRKAHSRASSRTSMHFRKTSGSSTPYGQTQGLDRSPPNDKRKNALIKETDYGVQPIKAPLKELAVKSDEIWGPVLGGREREGTLKSMLASVEKQRALLEVGTAITDSIKRREYYTLVEEYNKARNLVEDARSVMETASRNKINFTDDEVYQLVMTARMWADVDDQIQSFKRDVWRKLAGTHFTKQQGMVEEGKSEEYMELIGILMELGVDDNPIWVWLFSRYDFLRQKITGTFERSKVEIEILRRRLSYAERPPAQQLARNLRAVGVDGRVNPDEAIDSAKIVEVWDHIYNSMTSLLSTQGGILGEVMEYWETAQSFIEGKAQRDLPAGVNGSSRKHHRLSMDGIKALTSGATELLSLIRESVLIFFSEPPVDDLSMLLSPITASPNTPRTPKSATFGSFGDARLKVDVNDIPPPSPRRGESWEKYAFWPPYANSIGGVHYLNKLLALVGTAGSEMAGMSIMEGHRSTDQVKLLVGTVRERCVQAACAAWSSDTENSKVFEDWTRARERPDLTNMPSRLMDFEAFLVSNLQKMLYVSDAVRRPEAPEVIVPPPSKLLQMARSQFVGSIYKAVTGMKENTENPVIILADDPDGLIAVPRDSSSASLNVAAVDSSNVNIRTLLTLSNIQSLRNDIIPHLVTQFENSFTVQLTGENTAIREVLAQIDTRLFKAYVTPIAVRLDEMIREGIGASSWEPKTARPTDARPYIYNVLLELVLVHTEISTTAAPLTTPILKHLLEQVTLSLIEAFKLRPRYSLSSLMQATLDVEFLAQTLNNYTTDKTTETQSGIYVALDERTDHDARKSLQEELQEMRTILKRLREGTRTEFSCFKKQRPQAKPTEDH